MLRVTMNQCRDMLRRRQQRYAVPLDEAADVGVQDAHSEVLDVLEKLPEEYRVPLTLYYFEDCKVEEIARALGLGPSAVKMRLKRGREMMKKELEGESGHD